MENESRKKEGERKVYKSRRAFAPTILCVSFYTFVVGFLDIDSSPPSPVDDDCDLALSIKDKANGVMCVPK
jgi:hypothetical protein